MPRLSQLASTACPNIISREVFETPLGPHALSNPPGIKSLELGLISTYPHTTPHKFAAYSLTRARPRKKKKWLRLLRPKDLLALTAPLETGDKSHTLL